MFFKTEICSLQGRAIEHFHPDVNSGGSTVSVEFKKSNCCFVLFGLDLIWNAGEEKEETCCLT